jgi:hypothetical protein
MMMFVFGLPMIAYDPSTNPLNTNEWAFPVAECVHILGFALSLGTVALVDLRLLGLGMRNQSSAQLLKDTTPWTLIGLAIMLISGPVIFSSNPVYYVSNGAFQIKMVCLLLAIVFNYTIHFKVATSNAPAIVGKLVGAVSLALWVSVVAGGIFIAFI